MHDGEHVLQVISPHLSYDKIRISLWEGGYTAFAMDDSASWDRRGRAVPMPLDIRHTGALQFTVSSMPTSHYPHSYHTK